MNINGQYEIIEQKNIYHPDIEKNVKETIAVQIKS
jgi:hypothetical protein